MANKRRRKIYFCCTPKHFSNQEKKISNIRRLEGSYSRPIAAWMNKMVVVTISLCYEEATNKQKEMRYDNMANGHL